MGITENGLRKLAANKSSMPVMTASGNTKLDSSPGQGSARNPATPPTSASGNTKLDSSPGQGSKRNAATPVLSASGNTSLDSSPYEGEKGRAQQGDMAMTKDAGEVYALGFQYGMVKAASGADPNSGIRRLSFDEVDKRNRMKALGTAGKAGLALAGTAAAAYGAKKLYNRMKAKRQQAGSGK